MRLQIHTALAVAILGLGISLTPVHGQVILNPETLSGTVRFINSNPVILNLLNPPGNEGMSNLVMFASSLPPATPRSASSDLLPSASRTTANYNLVVDSDSAGIAYAVTPRVSLQGEISTYYFDTQDSPPVVTGVTPAPLDFDECVGVVTVQFVTAGGAPVPMDGGRILAFDAGTYEYTGSVDTVPAGVTQQRIFLRGGMTHRLDITVHRGTDYYTDRIESFLSTNILVSCDQFTAVKMIIPSAGSLAQVVGTVDMLGEFELTVPASPALGYADYTSVIARYGPYANERWAAVPGVNFTAPSSGSFTLQNVVPSTLDPLAAGYTVYAQMVFRTNRMIETFFTPSLGWGSNPPLTVAPGAALDLGNTFEINPGFLRGHVLLQGPAESLGRPSLLRGVLHASDDDADNNGIPDGLGIYGVYHTAVAAYGVDRRATGATLTAANGSGTTDFPGSFQDASGTYEGDYELVLGGLLGEPSLWKPQYLFLTLSSGTITNDDDYYYNTYYVRDDRTNEVEIVPGQPAAHDFSYCFGEVKIVFHSTSGTFYNPHILYTSSGVFSGTNFLGEATEYIIGFNGAYGTPTTEAAAADTGQVSMYLPEGLYTLYPTVTPSGGGYAQTGLAPIVVKVGCGQRIALEPCLQVSLDAPGCTATAATTISGSVRSCTNEVTAVSYTLNGGPEQVICNNCGVNPTFSFNLNLAGECVDNVLIVTATDADGGVSSVTTSIHHDATPPLIACPAAIAASSCDSNGVAVNFTVTATDNCAGPVIIQSTPPSGSVFPAGTTTVNCSATDACGNTSTCNFTVTVTGSELSIERAVIIRWACGGMLQSADDLGGPWTDVPGATSPYCVAATAAKKFYRTRN